MQSPIAELTAPDAALAAATALGVAPTAPFTVLDGPDGLDRSQRLSTGGIATDPIPARLVWTRDGKVLRLAWELTIDMSSSNDWWLVHIDALTGAEINRTNYNISHQYRDSTDALDGHANHAANRYAAGEHAAPRSSVWSQVPQLVGGGSSYNVFALPIESPSHGDRRIVANPADVIASPFGWHDTNGVAGAEFTDTRGNNVDAHTDTDDNDMADPGSRPNGGAALDFDFPLDLSLPPTANSNAAITNLFYASNMAHDLLYAHGFDEASGNFQENNYGRGGIGGDAVDAQAQDGGDTNNADFATPPDGFAPRMQMYNWIGGAPQLDGAFDNGVVLHEYAHGLSVRLTGGASNSNCLNRQEQAGEGWSDYVALVATMRPGDTRTQPRGIGTHVIREPNDGTGVRTYPYSTDFGVDPRTYDDVKSTSVPHGVGSVWAAMLWEMTWDLVDEYGFDTNVVRGDGGNNLALQLVIEGLKLQPCQPGFVDARDAILQADENLTDGTNECLIWGAFARRGLGFSANQGSPGSRTDGSEAFDLPPFCPLRITKQASATSVRAGVAVTFSITVENNSLDTETSVIVSDPLDARLTYVPGSATCGGSFAASTVTLSLATVPPGASRTCTFRAGTDADTPLVSVVFLDDFEDGVAHWRTTHDGSIVTDWSLTPGQGRSGSDTMFVSDDEQIGNQYLTLRTPVTLPAGAELSFWHRYDLESTYDGGVVEVSVDGGTTWADLGRKMVTNGYDDTIGTVDLSPIAGRPAFTGQRPDFAERSWISARSTAGAR